MQGNNYPVQSGPSQTGTTATADGASEGTYRESTTATETLDEKMARYFAHCKYKIKKSWRSHSKVLYLRIETKFRIHFDGSITNIVMTKSSGYAIEDNIALAAIRKVIPLPKFPAGAPPFYDIDFAFELSPVHTNEEVQNAINVGPPRRKSPPIQAPNQAQNQPQDKSRSFVQPPPPLGIAPQSR